MPNARDRCYHHFPSVSRGNACCENIFNHVSSEAIAHIFHTLAEEAVLMCLVFVYFSGNGFFERCDVLLVVVSLDRRVDSDPLVILINGPSATLAGAHRYGVNCD